MYVVRKRDALVGRRVVIRVVIARRDEKAAGGKGGELPGEQLAGVARDIVAVEQIAGDDEYIRPVGAGEEDGGRERATQLDAAAVGLPGREQGKGRVEVQVGAVENLQWHCFSFPFSGILINAAIVPRFSPITRCEK